MSAFLRGLGAVLAAALLLAAPSPAAAVQVTTGYPGIDVRPGDRVTLSLEVESPRAETVALSAAAPEGWEVAFRGGGYTVNRVYAQPGDPALVDLQVRVPVDAEPGEHEVRVRASAPSGDATLTLLLRINPAAAGRAELTPEYPVLQGPSGARFDYRLQLRNDSGERRLFTLSADAPQGWVVKFKPAFGSTETSSIPVDAGSSESIEVTVETPQRVEAGTYALAVRASAPGVTAAAELKAVITGTYDLQIKTLDERFNTRATAGRETALKLVLANAGTAPLHNVRLSSYEPSGWTVEFKPESVDLIPPGETREVTALIKPKSRSLAGDYLVTIDAQAEEDGDSAEFRVSVTTPTGWGVVGVLLVAAAVLGTSHVFRVYGRR